MTRSMACLGAEIGFAVGTHDCWVTGVWFNEFRGEAWTCRRTLGGSLRNDVGLPGCNVRPHCGGRHVDCVDASRSRRRAGLASHEDESLAVLIIQWRGRRLMHVVERILARTTTPTPLDPMRVQEEKRRRQLHQQCLR
jgi:hypothetical protein